MGLQELSRSQCLERLSTERIGRLGVTVHALPAIFPVNFLLRDGSILLRTVAGTKLHTAVQRAVVAFEVDRHDPQGRWGWSVLVRGVASLVEDEEEIRELDLLGLRAWAHVPGSELHWVRIETSVITGRTFGHPLAGEADVPVSPVPTRWGKAAP